MEQRDLEKIVDRIGIVATLGMLADICDDYANEPDDDDDEESQADSWGSIAQQLNEIDTGDL